MLKRQQQTNPNSLTLSVSVESHCMLSVMQTPSDLLRTGKSACLLNISQGETFKTGLLACDGTVKRNQYVG